MNEFMEYGFREFIKNEVESGIDNLKQIEELKRNPPVTYSNDDKISITPLGEEYLDQLQKELDQVNHPSHYTFGEYEVLDVIEDWGLGYHLGNVIKYVARAKHKGNELQDLQKAKFYLNRYVELKKSKEDEKYCEEIDS